MPLLAVVMALLVAWSGFARVETRRMVKPPGPGDVASALLEYHQAAVAVVVAAPSTAGTVTPSVPAWYAAGAWFQSCASASATVTWTLSTLPVTAQSVAAEAQALYWYASGVGVASQGSIIHNTGSTSIPAGCSVPNGAAAVLTLR
jgi:hypothetical protein